MNPSNTKEPAFTSLLKAFTDELNKMEELHHAQRVKLDLIIGSEPSVEPSVEQQKDISPAALATSVMSEFAGLLIKLKRLNNYNAALNRRLSELV